MIKTLPTILLIAILLEAGSTEVLLPALKEISQFYFIDQLTTKELIIFNLLALGLSSLIYGPLSDCLGRRSIYLFGHSLFCIGSIACCWVENFSLLSLFRFIQGLGGGVCATVGVAILKDCYNEKQYIKNIAWMSAILSGAPVIFSLIGGYLLSLFGLQSIFYFIAAISVLVNVILTIESQLSRVLLIRTILANN